MGDEDKAIVLADEALVVAERANIPNLLARALVCKGSALGSIGRLHEGIALVRAGGEVARESGNSEVVRISLVLLGYHLGEIDNEAAENYYRDGLELARRIGHRALTLQFVNNIGYTGFLTGEWDAALAEMDDTLDQDIELSSRIWILSNELIIRASRGEQVDAAIAELDRLVAEHGDEHLGLPTLDTKANYAQATGRLQEAREAWLLHCRALDEPGAGVDLPGRPAGNLVRRCRQRARRSRGNRRNGVPRPCRRGAPCDAARPGSPHSRDGRVKLSVLYRDAIEGWQSAARHLGGGPDRPGHGDRPRPVHPRRFAPSPNRTRAILERLGAKPYLERLDAAALAGRRNDSAHPSCCPNEAVAVESA